MLDDKTVSKIVEFVAQKPRTVQEIAHVLDRNWRTADRYVEQIERETGTIASRTFREGTRGALKIVYLTGPEMAASSEVQNVLLQRLLSGRKKEDFSPLDLYQYANPKERSARLDRPQDEHVAADKDLIALFLSAKESIMIFSGNLSWTGIKSGKTKITDVLEAKAREGVVIKIITRVDIATTVNLQRITHINRSLGKDAIEIRHAEQPLRCTIIDGKTAFLRETKSPEQYRKGELAKKTVIYYCITDDRWVGWLVKVFWKMFSIGISLKSRIDLLESIRRVR